MTAQTISSQIDDDQMRRYAKLIYDVAGIEISPAKKQLLSNRIRRRLKETGIKDFEAYYQFIRKLPPSQPEWDFFLQEVTTHETFLFRDESNWKWLRQTYLPEIKKEFSGSKRRSLRVWSAACSTGDEAYTIATCMAENLSQDLGKVAIVGTDIGVGAVEEAKQAHFNERAMQRVPDSLKRRFFKKCGDAKIWQPNDQLRKLTKFYQHNLLNRLPEIQFDLVFLKNVLIYFNADSKRRAMKHIESSVKSGGYLVVGAAEGVGEFMSGFERKQTWLYQRK